MHETMNLVGVLARLEALTGRLDEQAAVMASQAEEIIRLKARLPAHAATDAVGAKLGRRGMLTKALGATAAAALLTVAREPGPARADVRATLIADAADTYGLLASDGGDPITQLPNLNGNNFGAIGSRAPSGIPAPISAGVFGSGGASSGVLGLSSSGLGVQGQSVSNVGVLGVSQDFYGVFARSTNSVALAATSPSFAAIFTGNVFVTGSLTVASGAKSAAVKLPNGETRRVYCQESPEPWFEDFGTGRLNANGVARIPLDPDFDAVVKGDEYLVFLAEVGDAGGIYVSDQGPHRFEVRSRSAKAGTFNYRVVARRKDPVGGRLEKIDVPNAPTPRDLAPSPVRPNRSAR